jgi:uncharacterized repeat protein (TIGR01451 family)
MLFCDDFERSVVVGGSNTAGAVGTATMGGAWTVGNVSGGAVLAACAGAAGNRGCAGIDSDIPPFSTAANPRANATRSLFTRWYGVSVTSPIIDLSAKTGAKLTFWLRRGSDCFSEWPSDNTSGCGVAPPAFTPTSGEEFQVQYKNNVGAWIVLAQYPMDDAPGEIIVPVVGLPDDALHANFQMRFTQPGGSGSGYGGGGICPGGGTMGAPGVFGCDYWHVDNVVLEEVPGPTFTPGPFCDTFEGDLSRWDMAGTGNVRIGSTYFQNGIHNMDLRWNAVSATTKATSLATNSGNNIISFWVKRGTGVVTKTPNITGSEFPDTAAKGLKFEYFSSAGTWVALTTFAGAGTQGQVFLPAATPAPIGTAASTSFTIPANAKHANFKLRISMLAGSGLFNQDYWHVDDVCVGTTVGSTDLSMSMSSNGTFSPGQYVTYAMTVTNAGANPDPGPITIIDTLPTGLTFVGGSAGWACSAGGATGQTVTCTQNSGLAAGASTALTLTATVDATASGTITNTATVGGQTNDSNQANNTATKTDTLFVPGYVFTDRACTLGGGAIGTGAQCNAITWSPQTAGTPQGNIYITAVNASNVPIQLHATNPTTVNMQFGLSCINPAANAGVQATFDDGTTTKTLPSCTANGATPATWTSALALSFPATTPSVGPFNFNYSDVGSVELFMRNSAVTTQLGRSQSFVVKPAGFVLSDIRPTSNPSGRCTVSPDSTPACAVVAADTSRFVMAGEAFSATVKAVDSNGNVTPNYGQEAAKESVKLLPNNVVASMVTAPAIGGTFGLFSAGVATGTGFTWDEVGIITLTPKVGDGNYLGAGDVTGTTSGNVGRFYPAYFDTVVTQVAGAPMNCPSGLVCTPVYNGIVYSDQPFGVTVTAKSANLAYGTTLNYNTVTGFARNAALGTIGALGADTVPSGAGALAVSGVTAFVAGVATTATERYTFSTTPTTPTNIYVRASDGDASSKRLIDPTNTSVEGGVTVVSGRIKVANTYGSELLPLSVNVWAQYFNGSWINNLSDNVTPLGGIAASYAVGTGTTNVRKMPTDVPPTASETLSGGKLILKLLSPGSGRSGSVQITPTAPSYLPVASGVATFGVYKGANEFIYLRESY